MSLHQEYISIVEDVYGMSFLKSYSSFLLGPVSMPYHNIETYFNCTEKDHVKCNLFSPQGGIALASYTPGSPVIGPSEVHYITSRGYTTNKESV